MSDGPGDCARALWCQQERERLGAVKAKLAGYDVSVLLGGYK